MLLYHLYRVICAEYSIASPQSHRSASMPPTPHRRRYGLLPKRLRSSKAASRTDLSMYNSVPTLTGDVADDADQEPTSHLRLGYMADVPRPWTDAIPERWCDQMPEHWCTPQQPVQRIIFMLLCMGALGQFQMVQLWDACRNEETFRARKESFTERLTTITVVVSTVQIICCSYLYDLETDYNHTHTSRLACY